MNGTELFNKAVAFVAEKHSNQTRKDNITPYIYHPLKVAELVKDAGYGIEYQIVAVLHDILEDTDATDEEVRIFGDDIFESVKLLTRLPGADEEEYVNNILQNHMAAVVKNADKIHNMYECAYCENKKWAKKYVKKSMCYYYGKFSTALDHAIGDAEGLLYVNNPMRKPLYYSSEDMMLYLDKEIILYNTCKDAYQRCDKTPDFTNTNMQYWHNNFGDYYFCFTDDDNVWKLGKAGWLPRFGNPIQESEYGDNLTKVTRNEIIKFIEKMKSDSYFYDFVNLKLL